MKIVTQQEEQLLYDIWSEQLRQELYEEFNWIYENRPTKFSLLVEQVDSWKFSYPRETNELSTIPPIIYYSGSRILWYLYERTREALEQAPVSLEKSLELAKEIFRDFSREERIDR